MLADFHAASTDCGVTFVPFEKVHSTVMIRTKALSLVLRQRRTINFQFSAVTHQLLDALLVTCLFWAVPKQGLAMDIRTCPKARLIDETCPRQEQYFC